jgi:hypothetical protein
VDCVEWGWNVMGVCACVCVWNGVEVGWTVLSVGELVCSVMGVCGVGVRWGGV